MSRLLFCTLALSLCSATGVFAAPLDIAPSSTVRSAPLQDYVQPDSYARQKYARYNPAVAPDSQQRAAIRAASPHVYLMRGLMNVFSLGLDDLADRLRADGVAATVTNHADADEIVNRIVANYQAGDHSPIVLIGHSLGADAVVDMAQALDRYAIPVSLVVLFDGTAPHVVPGNVTTAVNFTKAFMISPRGDFHGTLSNVDLRGDAAIDHLTIEKSPALQATTIDYVLHAGSAQVGTATRRQ